MREVGRLFNANELIVAEVLQSAEAMKAAVDAPREVHGEDDGLAQGQGDPRDRQGRRPRHRQEPRRDHPVEQRLRGREPRHQGAAGEARRGVRAAPAGPDRPLGPARQERAADGHDGAGPDGGGRRGADARRRRRALAEVHGPSHRAGVRRASRCTPRTRCAASRWRTGSSRARTARTALAAEAEKRRAAVAATARPDEEMPARGAGRPQHRGRGRRARSRARRGRARPRRSSTSPRSGST